jgi:hypothetical protein
VSGSTTEVVFVGLIALATLAMAGIQVGLILVVLRLSRRLEALGNRFEQDLKPLVANATSVTANALRVSELAVGQIERADRLFADVAQRVDDTSRMVQGALLAPAREGRALLAALGAALGVVRGGRQERASGDGIDDDDPLFIG